MVKFFVKNKFDTGDFLVIVALIIGAGFIGATYFSTTEIVEVETATGDFCFDKNYNKILDVYSTEVEVYRTQINNAVNQVFANCDPNFGEVLWLFESCTRGKLLEGIQNPPNLNDIIQIYRNFGK